MKFNIDYLIKNLNALKENKIEFITEKELLKAATPKVNMIDKCIAILENLNNSTENHVFNACQLESILCGTVKGKHLYGGTISRPTFIRWIKNGIITQYTEGSNNKDDNDEYFEINYKNRTSINTIELLHTLKRIKEIHEAGN